MKPQNFKAAWYGGGSEHWPNTPCSKPSTAQPLDDRGRAGDYADPSSILRAAAMLLSHIGYQEKGDWLTKALDICSLKKRLFVTGRSNGATCREFGEYVMEVIKRDEVPSGAGTALK